ncbi:MAG: hypothetical protein AAB919_00620 [Patescibacteria group bacterium]
MTKWIIGVAVVVVVALGAWWYFAQAPAAKEAATPASTAPDTSDQALVQDSAAIDAQLQALDAQQ